MKILICAYACETGRGGEGEIGWRMIHNLAANHDVWVITRANLRPIHEAAFLESPKPDRLHFVYFDLPRIFRPYKRGSRFFLLYYYLWQLSIGLLARSLVRREKFDLTHHLTGGMDWMPAGLSLCPGPFLWGPVGSEDTHPVILRKLSLSSRAKDRARLFVRWAMRHLDPFVRMSGRRASIILTHTPETLPRRYAQKLLPFTQTGIEDAPALARPKGDLGRRGALRLLFAGELKDWKGASLALEATLKYFEYDREARLIIVGDGPLREQLEKKKSGQREGERVVMLGRVSMKRLVALMHESDIFLYPSFHHGLATVVLQAMLTGLPVVCIDGDATGRAVGQAAGITVPLHRDRNPADDVALAIRELAEDEPRRQALAFRAQRMAREDYTYASLAEAVERTYRQIGSDAW